MRTAQTMLGFSTRKLALFDVLKLKAINFVTDYSLETRV